MHVYHVLYRDMHLHAHAPQMHIASFNTSARSADAASNVTPSRQLQQLQQLRPQLRPQLMACLARLCCRTYTVASAGFWGYHGIQRCSISHFS
jgi:hypothetical protein